MAYLYLCLTSDGLQNLPPIDLRPDGEPYNPSGPTASRPTSPIPDVADEKNPSTESIPIPHAREARASISSTGSKTLSISPAKNDPLVGPAVGSGETSGTTTRSTSSLSVPALVLPDTTADEPAEPTEAEQIEQAMTESMMASPERPSTPATKAESVGNEKKPARGGTSGADLILPIIIYAVVRANPPQLASQLMYVRRYRSAICLTGEASYAIVNLTAVVEFLEHVELSQLGLGDATGKVMSVDDLTPIGLNYLDETNADAASIASASSRLRGRVFQVGELAGSAADSANKVITGVVDSSWTALRGLIGPSMGQGEDKDDEASLLSSSAGSRPGMRPRQASTFSLASVAASVATIAAAAANRSRSRANSRASAMTQPLKEEHAWKGNEEMVEVHSRPESVRDKARVGTEYASSDEESGERPEGDEGPVDLPPPPSNSGANEGDRELTEIKTVKSSSSLNVPEAWERDKEREKDRVSLSERLASIGVLRSSTPDSASGASGATGATGATVPAPSPSHIHSPGSGPNATLPQTGGGGGGGGFFSNIASTARHVSNSATHSRKVSLLGGGVFVKSDSSPAPSLSSLPPVHGEGAFETPNDHFMNCELALPILSYHHILTPGDVGDLRLSELGELLRDYRRLGNYINSLQKGAPPPPPA